MSSLDKLFDNQNNIATAGRALLEAKIEEGIRNAFSAEDWKVIGAFPPQIEVVPNSAAPSLVDYYVRSTDTLNGRRVDITLQYGHDFGSGSRALMSALLTALPLYQENLMIPASDNEVPDAQERNHRALLALIAKLSRYGLGLHHHRP